MSTSTSRFVKVLYSVMIYGFLYAPILILIVFSFNSSRYNPTVWEGFSFKWYAELVNNRQLLTAAANSLIVATLSATLATAIGTLGSISFFRFNYKGKNFLYALIYMVMMAPDVIMGIALLVLFITVKMPRGFVTLLITHITFALPFVLITLYTRLSNFDKHLVEAAKDLGADEFRTFLYIIFPMLMPAVISGWLLAFTISLDDVIGSFFVTGSSFQILPLEIYSMVRLGVKPEVNALSTLMFVFSLLLIAASQILLRDKNKVRKKKKEKINV